MEALGLRAECQFITLHKKAVSPAASILQQNEFNQSGPLAHWPNPIVLYHGLRL